MSGVYSPAEWCIIQDGVCILSYKHEILHKDLDVLFHIRVRGKLSFFNMATKSKMGAIDRFKDKKTY